MAEFAKVHVDMNERRFLDLLTKLIGETEFLQNNPSGGLIPKEDLASDHVMELIAPYATENGPLEMERITFVEGRGNLIIKYPSVTGGDKVCSFVGSHLDVVPADPKGWDKDPFTLSIDGDTLYGRGTTDCLGHVALLTDFMISLAEQKPALNTSIVVVFIANEENGSFPGIGVDQLAKEGYMDSLKKGPIFWVDAADSQPCIGTAGTLQWQLVSTGKLFHSGLPHKGINAIEMAMDATNYIQSNFFKDFPRHPNEEKYNFVTQSTLKPTQVSCATGSLNQIPSECTVQGDARISPFYDVKDVREKVNSYVDAINADPSIIESPHFHGPHSKYSLPDEKLQGALQLKWLVEGENGVACKLEGTGYDAIVHATGVVLGAAKPYSIGGSLPLIRDLQDQGFDVQISGYGISSRYHADNETASLSAYKQATKIVANIVQYINSH